MKAVRLPAIVIVLAGILLVACTRSTRREDLSPLNKYISRAQLFFEEENIDSCLYYLDLCFDIDRNYAPAHHLKGELYLYKDGIYNRRLSASSLKTAVKLEDENPEFHYSFGLTLERQGFLNNALREFEKAAELDSTDARPLARIAEINKTIGLRYDDEVHRFGRAVLRILLIPSVIVRLTPPVRR